MRLDNTFTQALYPAFSDRLSRSHIIAEYSKSLEYGPCTHGRYALYQAPTQACKATRFPNLAIAMATILTTLENGIPFLKKRRW